MKASNLAFTIQIYNTENIFRQIKWETFGIQIYGEKLHHLRFADDCILFAEDLIVLKTMLQQLSDQSKKAGLTMNDEYVIEYIYLGQVLSVED